MKKTNRTKPLRMAPRGIAVLVVLFLVVGFVIISVKWHSPPKKPLETKDWLVIEGNFADHPAEVTEPTVPDEPLPPVNPSGGLSSEPQSAEIEKFTYVPDRCVLLTLEPTAVHKGCLLRLDSQNSYSGDEGEMTTVSHSKGGYDVHSGDLELMPCTLEALDRMAQAYNAGTGQHDLLLYSTTEAGGIYDRELPDSPTGYCIDLALENEDGGIVPFYSRNAWLENNASRYGFIFSYTEENEEETGIESAPYHLRYVGYAQANLMYENHLTLDAYLDMISTHSTKEPVYYDDGNAVYTVFYVPKAFGTTQVPVPKNGNYDISGDNTNGFIVAAEGRLE